jgi:hypothetical protein
MLYTLLLKPNRIICMTSMIRTLVIRLLKVSVWTVNVVFQKSVLISCSYVCLTCQLKRDCVPPAAAARTWPSQPTPLPSQPAPFQCVEAEPSWFVLSSPRKKPAVGVYSKFYGVNLILNDSFFCFSQDRHLHRTVCILWWAPWPDSVYDCVNPFVCLYYSQLFSLVLLNR